MNNLEINIFNLYEFRKNDIFARIDNKNLFIYFCIGLIILYIAVYYKKFSYVFISICLFISFIYYSQSISHANYKYGETKKNNFLNKLNIEPNLLITKDDYLIELLSNAYFIKMKSPEDFKKLISLIEDFFIIYESLKQNKNNIFLSKNELIKPVDLNPIQHSILINDIRDQLERILKHIQTIIHKIPHDSNYLDAYYMFNQLIRAHLSRYYNRILSDYKYSDHTSQYQLIRISEDKYGFIDEI